METNENLDDDEFAGLSKGLLTGDANPARTRGEAAQLLSRLHDKDIVHSDAHLGNFVTGTIEGQTKMWLIDFGKAFRVNRVSEEAKKSCTDSDWKFYHEAVEEVN